ncbi:MAG TPA: hypothetical protein DCQ06_09325, partial [Myxococcales bacterium]|nr:hypothetical protein [Myxococcales bacterium]
MDISTRPQSWNSFLSNFALTLMVSISLNANVWAQPLGAKEGAATTDHSVSQVSLRGVTSADLCAIQQIRQVVVAPNGADLAWSIIAPRVFAKSGRDRPRHQIWVKSDGAAARKVVEAQGSIRGLRWMRDGKELSYLRAQRGGRALVAMRADGSKERVLMRFADGIASYSWASDGKHIAFTSRPPAPRREGRRRGYRVAVDLDPGPNVGLFVARVASNDKAHGRARQLVVSGSCSQPRFRPDGGAIAVAVAPDGSSDSYVSRREIQIVTFDGSKPTRIGVLGKLLDLRWSPDGKRLAFIAGRTEADPAPSRLYVAQGPKWRPKAVRLNHKGHVRVVRWVSSTRVIAALAQGLHSVLAVFDVRTGRSAKPWPVGSLVVEGLAIAEGHS